MTKVFQKDEFFMQMIKMENRVINGDNDYFEKLDNKIIYKRIIKFVNEYPDNIEQVDNLLKKYSIDILEYNIKYKYRGNKIKLNGDICKLFISYISDEEFVDNDKYLILVKNYYKSEKILNKLIDIIDYLSENQIKRIINSDEIYDGDRYSEKLILYLLDNHMNLCGNNLLIDKICIYEYTFVFIKQLIEKYNRYDLIDNFIDGNHHNYNNLLAVSVCSLYNGENIENVKWIIENSKDQYKLVADKSINNMGGRDYDDSEYSVLGYAQSYYSDDFELVDYLYNIYREHHQKNNKN